ncbi:ArsR/SmtB family transcription factor [Anoxybacillus ayderensis]|uniref:ArsR/SmtB family transcription factor n=1 Tax=Anoxybacillus ayderensis TaxID=265546 RepID=UPI000A26E418|nr:metalloregulator ArsR/SmtB family transcription factor [Anoxybacillus ayderensis]MED0658293.1 metalloregulator ArsR/SmtB family transcription factor [Anoxybacillus ayderensis]OSX53310.1 transcriptional regulator [Anoxybacillus ayderensis]
MKNHWQLKNEQELNDVIEKAKQTFPFLQDDQLIQHRAQLFKALGDETRLRIVGMLMHSDLCMCEITAALQLPPSTVTHHLKLLERGKVVHVYKQGKFTIYQLNQEVVMPLMEERRDIHV